MPAALLALAFIATTILYTLAPDTTEGAVYNPIPANQFGDPTDTFTEADAIYAYFTADLGGGRICVVPATQTEPSGCGESGRIIGATIGTGYTLIEAEPTPGQYRLNTADSVDTPLQLSPVYSVSVCAACPRDLTDAIVDDEGRGSTQCRAIRLHERHGRARWSTSPGRRSPIAA